MDLPPEIWLEIFCHLDNHRILEPLSLVSKQFLTLTNSLRTTLSLPNPAAHFLPSLFLRFETLDSIDLSSFRGDPTSILLQIADYYPHLESLNLSRQQRIPWDAFHQIGYRMKGLKVLDLSLLEVVDDKDMLFIADCFPNLEELDISYPEFVDSPYSRTSSVTDVGIYALSVKLKNLSSIDISGNHSVTDIGVIALGFNCVFLKKIAVDYCCSVTPKTIGWLLNSRPELEKLSIKAIADGSQDPFINWAISFEPARCLSSLDLMFLFVPDEWLFLIGKAQFPLKRLNLSCTHGFSIEGLMSVFRKHRWIEHLELEGLHDFLTDNHIFLLSGFLSELVFVNLSYCHKLTAMAFYYLTQACPLLEIIKIGGINILEDDSSMHFAINSQVSSLHLECNYGLTDRCLENFVKLCPNLQFLDVSDCPKLSEAAVLLVLKECSEITHLEINLCEWENLKIDFDVPRLEVLRARGAELNGEAIAAIGKRCPNLWLLDLAGRNNVSIDAVKEVVTNCKGLREINVGDCKQLNVDIVSWMVLARPSLRKIILPCGFILSEAQRNFFFRHGCLVCEEQ